MRISTQFYNQRGVNSILEQQNKLAHVQEQIASGKRILRPSDDPSGSTQIIRLTQVIKVTGQYQRNADFINNRLSLEESILENVENSLLRVRELALQGGNSTLSNDQRRALSHEVRERLDELLGLANTRDANDEYLFAGYQVKTKPFAQSNGIFSYSGDQGKRLLQISSGRQMADSNTGYSVFMDIINGNGTFQVQDNAANTGTGIISTGQVVDSAAYVADTYTITFVTNSNGNLGYNVVAAVSGQLVPPLPQNPVTDAPDFTSEAAITFNGIETSITGTPVAGDTFTVSPSVKQDVFTTLNNLANALETNAVDDDDEARVANAITRSILDIDQAFNHMTEFRTSIGARLKTIEDQQDVNASYLIDLQSTLSGIQDVDFAQAVTELQLRTIALQAAQSSFIKIQNLSLFEFM